MFRYFFSLLLFLHGLIHLMGFARAFGFGNITQLAHEIPKPVGYGWLFTSILLITAAFLCFLMKESWALTAIVALICSQVLIIMTWKDAKYGTIANIIILFAAVPAFAESSFNRAVKNEAAILLAQVKPGRRIITEDMMEKLPPICRKWLLHSGVAGKENIEFVRLKQKGQMRTKPGGKWMPFTATQYFGVNDPQFVWQTKVHMSLIEMGGRDKFNNGNGDMKIKLLYIINVVDAGGNEKINQSTMLRYLAETCWFPTAALADYLTWEPIDSVSAKATMAYKGQSVSGIFQFTADGDLISFCGDRWYGNGDDEHMEKWLIEVKSYQTFQGIRVPCRTDVTWKLKSGDFNWLNLEIADLEFNHLELYN